MKLKERYGNLVREAEIGVFDVILHGCNCHNTMGAGIAKTIKDVWPGAYDVDTQSHKEGKAKLGNISIYKHEYPTWDWHNQMLHVVNCYTQEDYSRGKRNANYEAIAECFDKVRMQFLHKEDVRIGIPLIGCGLAGGDWKIVSAMVDVYFKGMDVTIVKFPEDLKSQTIVSQGAVTKSGFFVLYKHEEETYVSTESGLSPIPEAIIHSAKI